MQDLENVGRGIQITSSISTSPATEMCDICLLVPRGGVALVPYGHARSLLRLQNADKVTGMGNSCPLCRTPRDMVLRVFS